MGVGPFSSESNAQDSRQAAGDNSNLVHGKGTVTEAGGVTVTGKINTGAQNSKIGNNTIKAGKGSKITIDNGGEAVSDLTSKFLDTLAGLSAPAPTTPVYVTTEPPAANSGPGDSGGGGGWSDLVDSILNRSLNPPTPGAGQSQPAAASTSSNSKLYWIAGAILLAGLGFFFFKRRA
jgi:LPXTG-motif cell wall-anchored protein